MSAKKVLDRVHTEISNIVLDMDEGPQRERLATLLYSLQPKAVGSILTNAEMRERRTADDYQTDPRLCKAFFEHDVLYRKPQRVLDVGAGIGMWGRALAAKYPDVEQHGIDIQQLLMPPDIYGRRFVRSFLDERMLPEDPQQGGRGYTHIGWNFPYGNSEHRDLITTFMFKAYTLLPVEGVGEIWCLTRLNWLSGVERSETIFGSENPAQEPWREDVVVLSTRPTFYYPIEARSDWEGGKLDDVYEGHTYPSDYAMVRFAFENRKPVGTQQIIHRLVYDKKKPKKPKKKSTPTNLLEAL